MAAKRFLSGGDLANQLKQGVRDDTEVDFFLNALNTMARAITNDITMVINPTTVDRLATNQAFTRTVLIEFQDDEGNVHEWLNDTFSGLLSIGDTSTAGTASIASTDMIVENGRASVIVSGDAADWLAAETNTLTIGNPTVAGNIVTGGTSIETIV